MSYQPKISTTQKYSDSQGEHIVCEGKLRFIPKEETYLWYNPTLCDVWREEYPNEEVYMANGFYEVAPIIISETEEIEVGDWYYIKHDNSIRQLDIDDKATVKTLRVNKEIAKILALPEHFSDKHLQAIVDGKMKNNDKVLVKCVEGNYNYRCFDESSFEFFINLNQQNHITLFPAEQSLEEVSEVCANILIDEGLRESGFSLTGIQRKIFISKLKNAVNFGAEWAVKNNYKGGGVIMENDPEYGVKSEDLSKEESKALMESRLNRAKNISKEDIVKAKNLQSKLSLEEAAEEWHQKNYPETHDSKERLALIGKKIMKSIWKEGAEWAAKNNYKGED